MADECDTCRDIRSDYTEDTERLERRIDEQDEQIAKLTLYVEVLERCSDSAEVYHNLLDRGFDAEQIKKLKEVCHACA